MKNILIFIIFALIYLPISAQSKKDLISIWDGGEAFAGVYEEKRFLIEFTETSFHMQYGPNHYKEYTGYILKSDILTITRSDKHAKKYQPRFKIIRLNSSELVLEAANWAAVYITSVLSTPYIGCANEDTMVNNTDKDLTVGDMLNTQLIFKKITESE